MSGNHDLAAVALVHILQSSFVLGCALLLSRLLRNHGPALRHCSLLSIFLALPLLPLLSRLIEVSGIFTGALSLLPEQAARIPKVFHTTGDTAAAELTAVPTTGALASTPAAVFEFPWPLAGAMLLTGFLVILTPVVACRVRIVLWRLRGTRVADQAVMATFRRAARQLNLSGRFQVIEHHGVAAPFTSGAIRPAVFLPTGFARTLSPDALHEVALHELAHIKRRDSLTLTIVAVLRSLYFWNPLAWIAAGRIARLAEEACDTDVLRLTGNPVRYAKMLTTVAERLPSRRFLMESPAGIIFSQSSFRRRIEAILDSGRRQLINRHSRIKLTVFLALVFFTFATAASAPAITAIEEPLAINDTGGSGDVHGSELHNNFDRLDPDMNRSDVEAILGPPDDTVTVRGRADTALVWKQSKFLFTTETVIVAFRDNEAVMLTHSSGPILNVRKHVEEALADNTNLAVARAGLRAIREAERFDRTYDMRGDVTAMLNHLEVSGEERFEVDPENAARFDGIALGTSYDKAVGLFGQPEDVDLRWGKTVSTWRWNGDTVILGFKDRGLISKAFKSGGREALVEQGQWQAKAGRTTVTVIED